MLPISPRRQRDRKKQDPAVPISSPDTAPTGPAGGDLGGMYPNPTVLSLAHVTTGPAVYPTGSAANLTNVPTPPSLQSGLAILDGSGIVNITTVGSPVALVASPADIGGGMSGMCRVQPLGGNSWNIESTAGAADSGWQVFWIAF